MESPEHEINEKEIINSYKCVVQKTKEVTYKISYELMMCFSCACHSH